MFDTINGLPVHALVVHAVVVLLPLCALLTVAVAALPRWRPHAPWMVAADALVVVTSFVARQSGEALQARLSQFGANEAVANHADYGRIVPLFSLALLVAAVVVWLGRRTAALVPIGLVLAVVTAIGAIGWTVVTGDTGARAVYGDTIKNTRAP